MTEPLKASQVPDWALNELLDAARAYKKWADRTKDYPHDEEGCAAHQELIDVIESIDI